MASGRGEATTWAQRNAILEWLEIPANFKLISGDGSSTLKFVVAGAKLTKEVAYAELADYVNSKCGTNWAKKSAESRYKAYRKSYMETKRAIANGNNEKFCIGPEDIVKGIDTIKKKIELACPNFDRMDNIFGSKQNVIPFSVLQPSKPSAVDTSDSEEVEAEEVAADDATSTTAADGFLRALAFDTVSNPANLVATQPMIQSSVKKRNITAAQASISTPIDLQLLSAASIDRSGSGELADKISIIKKGKTDFGSSYADGKREENSLLRQRFEWEQANYPAEQALKAKVSEDSIKCEVLKLEANTKKEVTLELIRSGKSPQEVKEYLEMLGY